MLRSCVAWAKVQRQGTSGRPCAVGVHVFGELWGDMGGRAGELG